MYGDISMRAAEEMRKKEVWDSYSCELPLALHPCQIILKKSERRDLKGGNYSHQT